MQFSRFRVKNTANIGRCRQQQSRNSSQLHHDKLVTAAAAGAIDLLPVIVSELHATGNPTESCLL